LPGLFFQKGLKKPQGWANSLGNWLLRAIGKKGQERRNLFGGRATFNTLLTGRFGEGVRSLELAWFRGPPLGFEPI